MNFLLYVSKEILGSPNIWTSLSSSTTCSVSSRPSNCKSTSDCKDSSECYHSSDDMLQAFLISGFFCVSHLDLQSAL